jgi:hypothetical protein
MKRQILVSHCVACKLHRILSVSSVARHCAPRGDMKTTVRANRPFNRLAGEGGGHEAPGPAGRVRAAVKLVRRIRKWKLTFLAEREHAFLFLKCRFEIKSLQ